MKPQELEKLMEETDKNRISITPSGFFGVSKDKWIRMISCLFLLNVYIKFFFFICHLLKIKNRLLYLAGGFFAQCSCYCFACSLAFKPVSDVER